MSIEFKMPEMEHTTVQRISNDYIEIVQGDPCGEQSIIRIPVMYENIFLNYIKAATLTMDGE